MSQLIPGGFVHPDPARLGPVYPLACPLCGGEALAFGRAEDLGYNQAHHGPELTAVEVPVRCPDCATALTVALEPDVLGALTLSARRR